jgi:hypothetical protein
VARRNIINRLRYSRSKPVNSGINSIFSYKGNTILIHSKGTLKDYSEGSTDMTISVMKVRMIELRLSSITFGKMNQNMNKVIKKQGQQNCSHLQDNYAGGGREKTQKLIANFSVYFNDYIYQTKL